MANWFKPLITDLYTQVLDWLKDRDTDLAKGLDPAAVTVENPQAGFIRYSSANRRWEKFDGTSWAPLATSYAINADTASKWATPRTLTLGGGATGSVSIDGAGNVTLTAAITQGPGSGLNADLLDNQQGAWYADIPARLGFTPVQQGTGVGQTANSIKIGWSSGGKLKATVDSTDLGNIAFEAWATSHVASAIAGKANTSGTYSGLNVGYAASAGNANTVGGWPRDDIRAWPNLSAKPAGADINFYWSGQAGQPSWVWGQNEAGNAYVWSPANFNVAYATNAGHATNADTLDGYHASQFWRNEQASGGDDWFELPNGWIFQFGSFTPTGPGSTWVTFPVAFPSTVKNIQVTIPNAGADNRDNAYGATKTGFWCGRDGSSGLVYWMAIGRR